MTTYAMESATRDVAYAIKEVAKALYSLRESSRTEPVFIFVPSDLTVEDAKKLGEALSSSFKGKA